MNGVISTIRSALPDLDKGLALNTSCGAIGTALAAWTFTILNPATAALIGGISIFAIEIFGNIGKLLSWQKDKRALFAIGAVVSSTLLISKVILGLSFPSACILAVLPCVSGFGGLAIQEYVFPAFFSNPVTH